jgi:hypothetical protein
MTDKLMENEKCMKYDTLARIVYLMYQRPIFKYLETVYGKKDTKLIKRKTKRIYREMLERTPGIGGSKENSLTGGLVMGCLMFAIYLATDRKMKEEIFANVAKSAGNAPILKKIFSKKDPFSEKSHRSKASEAIRSQKSDYSMDWKFTHEAKVDEYFTTYTKCGICELAKKEDCFHLVKYICKIDYITIDLMGGKLERTKTIADGYEICDFHVIRKV